MKGFVDNIEKQTQENFNFRKVIYTAKNAQLVLMSLQPGEEIGQEIHDVDQFFRIESGLAQVIIDGNSHDVTDGFAIIVTAGAKHNVINTGSSELKLYTLYCPPHHADKTVHPTKLAAEKDTAEHFTGDTTE